MTQSQNFKNAIAALNALTASELNDLVPQWKLISKHKRSVAGAIASQDFNVNDVLTFNCSKRGYPPVVHIKFSHMNRASTCVVGMMCDPTGKLLPPLPGRSGQWTVAITNITSVNGKARG